MVDKIKQRIGSGEITALTLDTSIFERSGLALETGLLAQLIQFRESQHDLVIARTVASEVKRHLSRNAVEAAGSLRAALDRTEKHRAFPTQHQQKLIELADEAAKDIEVRAERRLDEWVQLVGAEILDEREFASLGDIMQRYEAAEPPFAENGKKKSEFPDAVALSTIEGWAKLHDTRVLAVSADKDWQRYGSQSDRLVVIEDLGAAISCFQVSGDPSDVAARISERFISGDSAWLQDAVLGAVRDQTDKFDFFVEANSQFLIEQEWIDVTVEDIALEISDPGGGDLEIISQKEGEATLEVKGSASLTLSVAFSFEKYDSIDRDYIGMGRTVLSEELTVEFSALVTVLFDADDLNLDSIELLPSRNSVYFSDVVPDWMDEPRDYEAD